MEVQGGGCEVEAAAFVELKMARRWSLTISRKAGARALCCGDRLAAGAPRLLTGMSPARTRRFWCCAGRAEGLEGVSGRRLRRKRKAAVTQQEAVTNPHLGCVSHGWAAHFRDGDRRHPSLSLRRGPMGGDWWLQNQRSFGWRLRTPRNL